MSIHYTNKDTDNVVLCFTDPRLNKELSIGPIEMLGQEPSSPPPCTKQAPSYHKTVTILDCWYFSFHSFCNWSRCHHLMGNAISPSIDEHYNVSTDVVYLRLPAVVTGREDNKITAKSNISGFSKGIKLRL